MKPSPFCDSGRRAFTLIELLVVISIIAILAAMIIPASMMVKRSGTIRKAKAEINQVALAIDSYKDKLGHYPPDNPQLANPGRFILNPLFYELQGTIRTGVGANEKFQTLDGRTNILVRAVPTAFGGGIAGFVNCTRAGGGDDFAAAHPFLANLKPGQYGFLANGAGLLTSSVEWPPGLGPVIAGAPAGMNPIRYNSSSPTNNPNSYDLWVDVVIGNKTNRISNWSENPEIN
jgi:prepilin-type N-terminal cleavage/methylation domain-containing protein